MTDSMCGCGKPRYECECPPKVVGMGGRIPPEARVPYQPLIDMLEEALERAQSGEIQGMCTSYLYHDGVAQFWNVSRTCDYALIGAAEASKAAIAHEFVKDLPGFKNDDDD